MASRSYWCYSCSRFVWIPNFSPFRDENLFSPASSLSTRRMLSVLPDSRGLRTRVSLSSVSKNFRASKLRRGVICEAQDSTTGIPLVTDSTFESLVLKAEEPILVDFWAPWCGPCKMIDPVVNELAQPYAGKMKFLQTKQR